MSSGKPIKIVIFGQMKTGTTAHMFKIKNSLPKNTRMLHEPHAYIPKRNDNKHFVLAKVIAGKLDGKEIADYESFMQFDKKILIVRDPRDWIISAILFYIHGFYGGGNNLSKLISLFEKKEEDPASVTLIEIINRMSTFMENHTFESLLDWISRQQNWLVEFEKRLDNYCISRYEEFVDGNMSVLEEYLGMELHGAALVGKGHEHKSRTKGYGDWKNWFTKEDIELFKPIFAAYMDQYDYTDEWKTNDPQIIDPEYCSEYIKKTLQYKMKLDIEDAKRINYFYTIKRMIRTILQMD
jgi:hypothetical protein